MSWLRAAVVLFGCLGVSRTSAATCDLTWEPVATIPSGAFDPAICAVGGTIYVAGGWLGSYLTTFRAFDTATKTWTTKAAMPTARSNAVAAAIGGTIYVMGGSNGGSGLTIVEAYDLATNSWTTLAPMSVCRLEFAAEVLNGLVYVVGGDTCTPAWEKVEAYDPATNAWIPKPNLPTGRIRVTAAVVGGSLYVAGGTSSGATTVPNFDVYDPATNTWKTLPPMPTARIWHAAAVLNGRIYQLGGYSFVTSAILDSVESFDPATGVWSVHPGLTAGRYGMGAATIGNSIYIAAGVTNFTLNSTIERTSYSGMKAAMAVTASPVSIGQWTTVAMTVTNVGCWAIDNLMPTIRTIGPGGALVLQWSRTEAASLLPGSATTFLWTYSVSGGGLVTFSVTATGLEAGAGATVRVHRAIGTPLGSPANLSAALAINPSNGCAGQTITISLTVSNSGDASAVLGTPYLGIGFPATVLTWLSGPTPGYPFSVGGHSATTANWTYQVGLDGPAPFTGSLSAQDGTYGNALAVMASAAGSYGSAASLSASLGAPATVSVGQWFDVVGGAKNSGNAPADTVSPYLAVAPPAGRASFVSGPSPAGPLSIPGQTTRAFTWTYSAVGIGLVTLTTTMTGVESCSGGGLSVSAIRTVLVQSPAMLTATAIASPAVVRQGETISVRWTVTNTGQAGATGLTATSGPVPNAAAARLTGPVPPSGSSLAGGNARIFTWTYEAIQSGLVEFSVTASGIDANAGWPLQVARMTTPIQVTAGAVLKSALWIGKTTASVGETVELRLTVSSTGDHDAAAVGASLSFGDPAGAEILSGPLPAGTGTVPAGTLRVYSWTIRLVRPGSLVLTALAAGQDAVDAVAVSTNAVATITAVRRFEDPLVVFPNPVTGDTLKVYARPSARAHRCSVEVWNLAQEKVYEGSWIMETGEDVLEIRGIRRWAPGLYVLRVGAELADGTTEMMPFVRVMVRP